MSEDLGAFSAIGLEPLNLVLITGMSGAGKSVALRALEDAGYFCVDNLPPELVSQLLKTLQMQSPRRHHVAIAVDGRSAISLPLLPKILQDLEALQIKVKLLYLDANDDALIRRFSETRRRHPLSSQLNDLGDEHAALVEAIEQERALLAGFKEFAAVIDTSLLKSAQLQSWIKTIVQIPHNVLTLVFESFAFKRGIPVDADFVFDVRILPNPYYVPELRSLTGKDFPIQQWLRQHGDVLRMQSQIEVFLREWLPAFVRNHRSYLTVAIGCTGGQHRSVYLVEQLAQVFPEQWSTVVRHRELDSI